MFARISRLFIILTCLVGSMVLIHRTTNAPARLKIHGFSVACLPINDRIGQADEQLRPYFHVAHTTLEEKGSPVSSYRCYFRFPIKDVACMPINAGKRNPSLANCPCFITSIKKACYFLNKKHAELITLLKQKPPISHKRYNGCVVETWQEVRDKLTNNGNIPKYFYPNVTSLKRQKGS